MPVNDVNALAIGITKQLEEPVSRDLLIKRAKDFSSEKIASKYLRSFEELY